MSECVVRMEMPQRCDSCDFWHVCKNVADFGAARYFEGPRELTVGMKGCKIVCPLPEGHGTLIDLETAAEGLSERYNSCHMICGAVMQFLDGLPTIVPAEAERSET